MVAAPAVTLRAATDGDLDRVAAMNRDMIEDEGARNSMTTAELRRRFSGFLRDGWSLDLFLHEARISGYALHRYEPDPLEASGRRVHLRHFFVARQARGRGLGRAALAALSATRWRAGDRIVLDVLESNPGGRRFWRAVGFAPYAEMMESRVDEPR